MSDDSVTKDEKGSPKNVGDSSSRSGEDIRQDEGKEPGRKDTGTQGETKRPVGESSMRDSTGIDPQDPIDDDSPILQTP